MTHPLVMQLRFARSELLRGLANLSDEDAATRVLPMNCISWNVGHLASQEQRNWLTRMQNRTPLPQLQQDFGNGSPASTLRLSEVLGAWRHTTTECDKYLDTLITEGLQQPSMMDGKPTVYSVGTLLLRQIYHYWYHIGENMAIRQMLGHHGLAEYVGDLHSQAPYEPH
jgi:hypothetical protein